MEPNASPQRALREVTKQRILQRMKEVGRKPAEVSRAIGKGVDYLRDFLSGRKADMGMDAMAAIARELDTTIAWLQGDDQAKPEHRPRAAPAPNHGEVPVYGVAAGSLAGAIHVLPDVIEYVARPPGIAGLIDVYALYVIGYSMVPRFRPGEIVFAAPHRPARPGDDVVLQVRKGDGVETESWVKELVRETDEDIIVRQHNPPAEMTFPRGHVAEMHRILPINELVGI